MLTANYVARRWGVRSGMPGFVAKELCRRGPEFGMPSTELFFVPANYALYKEVAETALAIYRERFQPSEQLQEPYAMIAVGVCAADSDAEAEYLRSSQIQGFANIVTNKRGKLPLPTEDLASKVPSHTMHHVNKMLSCSAVGARDKLKSELSALIERHRPDELMVTGMIHDHPARVRSFDIAAEVLGELVER